MARPQRPGNNRTGSYGELSSDDEAEVRGPPRRPLRPNCGARSTRRPDRRLPWQLPRPPGARRAPWGRRRRR